MLLLTYYARNYADIIGASLELELEASHPKDDAVQGCGHTY